MERFRRAHRRGMLALRSADADRFRMLGDAIAEERRAVDDYFEALAERQKELRKRREKSSSLNVKK